MQRTEPDGIVISCDFCGTDWDEVLPMIEGHKGSILCLECLKIALDQASPASEKFECTMCLRELTAPTRRWAPLRDAGAAPAPGANPRAVVCFDCINQAAGTYSKDPDVDWKRP